jgi:hypothetical protein
MNIRALLVPFGFSLSFTVFPRPAQAQSALVEPKVCMQIQQNPQVRAYIDGMKKLAALDSGGARARFDSQDRLIGSWIANQLKPKLYFFKSNIEKWSQEINQCAFIHRNDDLLIFLSQNSNPFRFRQALNQLAGADEQPARRTIDASGNVVMERPRTSAPKIDWRKVNIIGVDGGLYQCIQMQMGCPTNVGEIDTSVSLWAFFLPDGEKVIANIGDDLMWEVKEQFAKAEARIAEEKVRTAEAEARERARAEEERKFNAENARFAAEQARDKAATAKRVAEIKRGDWRSVTSCRQVAEALYSTGTVDDGIAVKITPTNRITFVQLPLYSYDENTLLGTATGMMNSSQLYVKFNTTRTTKWYSKQNIALRGTVAVLGRYTANTSVQLVNGAEVKVPVIEATCVSR